MITIAELDAYTKEALPPIAELFPDLVVSRDAARARSPRPTARGLLNDSTSPCALQTARMSFPLIRMRRGQKQAP